MYLHPALDHLVNELVLALGNLDDLLDQTSTNLALQVRDTVQKISIGWPPIGRVHLRLDSVLWLRSEDSRRESALRLVVLVALHGPDVLPALLLRPDALGEGLGNLSVPLGFPVLAVVDVLQLGKNNSNTAVVLDGVEMLWVLGDLREDLFLPCVPALRLRFLNDPQAVAGKSFGGLAVYGGLRDLVELGEGAGVVVEQCRARRRVCSEACEAGGGAGLEELAGLDGGEES